LAAVRVIETGLNGPRLIEPVVHGDERGFFLETYRRSVFADLGIDDEFVQDNHSRSRRGVLRGLHFQPGMAKLVRCARGEIFDVVVDVRPGSDTFGRWEGHRLSDANHRMLYCPDGFAHGFCVLSDEADVVYLCSAYWDPRLERAIAYDDPEIGIEWPLEDVAPSARDAAAPSLGEVADELRRAYAR
jgi:dTDP-4-dehydrorhamnose 3,5-epimerase